MNPSSGQNIRRKNTAPSIRAGIWHAIGGFLLGTIIAMVVFVLLMAIIANITGLFSEVGLPFAIASSPVAGLIAGIVTGIRGGRQTYKALSEGK